MVGRGMQQALEPSRGVSRRGGVKPRGRNGTRDWHPGPKDGKLASRSGVDARGDLARGFPKGKVDGGAKGEGRRCEPVVLVQPQERIPA